MDREKERAQAIEIERGGDGAGDRERDTHTHKTSITVPSKKVQDNKVVAAFWFFWGRGGGLPFQSPRKTNSE